MADTPTSVSTNVDISTNGEYQSRFVESVAQRVRAHAARLDYKQSTIAAQLQVSTSTIGNYWHGDRPWPAESILRLARLFDVSTDDLLSGDTSDSRSDLVSLEEIDLAYGLGSTFSDRPIETITHSFPKAWLERITTTPSSMLTIAHGRGDSMQPTIQDGDMVIIDRSIRSIREQDAIWALTLGDFAMIKRVRSGGERIRILSDNTNVPPDDVFHEEVNVVGRVIFIGRRL